MDTELQPKVGTSPLQGLIISSFLSRWSLWHFSWQRRHSRAGGGLKTCHRGLEQPSQLEGKWYRVGMNSWPLCWRKLVLSPWGTVSTMSASFLHSPSLAYKIWRSRGRRSSESLGRVHSGRSENPERSFMFVTELERLLFFIGNAYNSAKGPILPGISWESLPCQLGTHPLVWLVSHETIYCTERKN